MRSKAFLIAAAALILSAPASAQNDVAPANDTTTATTNADTAPMDGVNTMDSDAAMTNGLTAGPGAAPATADPMAVDTGLGEPEATRDDDDDGFPWGVLGLLGLLGLIPRRKRG